MSTLFYGFPCVSRKMNTRKTSSRRVEENDAHEDISPQIEQVEQFSQRAQNFKVPFVGGGNVVLVAPPKWSNGDIRESFFSLSRAVTTQANLRMVPRVNVLEIIMMSMLRNFVKINRAMFL